MNSLIERLEHEAEQKASIDCPAGSEQEARTWGATQAYRHAAALVREHVEAMQKYPSLEALAQRLERDSDRCADLSPTTQDEKMKRWGLVHAYSDAAETVRNAVIIPDRGLSAEQREWLKNCDSLLTATELTRRFIARFELSSFNASQALQQFMQEAYHGVSSEQR